MTFYLERIEFVFGLLGFLMGGILLDTSRSRSYFRASYVCRAYRIIPLYAVVLMAAFLVQTGTIAESRDQNGSEAKSLFLFMVLFRL